MNKQATTLTGAAAFLVVAGLTAAAPAQADGAGAFIGGMLTSRVIRNMSDRTQAQESMAYNQQQQSVQQAPPAKLTPQQRMQQLDKLAAGGYITPEEYKTKKQAIVNSM
jgi:hypothetical protein